MTQQSAAMVLVRELTQVLRDLPEPEGQDALRRDLNEALDVIDKLLNALDALYTVTQQGKWIGDDGKPVDGPFNWLHLACFGEDHELYDSIHALRGRNRRSFR